MTSTSENALDHHDDHDASSPALPPMIPGCDPHDGAACLELIEVLTARAGDGSSATAARPTPRRSRSAFRWWSTRT
uniref:Uncharacterized protein n=1 Tax=Oryza brachyantha TaxID=4533 RepID=J3N8S2_ORYBR